MKTERVFFVLVILILIMKYAFLIPMTGPMLVLVLSALPFIYFPGGIYFFSDKEFKNQKIWLSLIIGFLLSSIPIGIMFKIMYWPGDIMTLYGVVMGSAATVLAYIMNIKADETDPLKPYYKNLVIRSIVATAFIIIVFVIPTNTLIRVQFRDDPELVRLTIQAQENPGNDVYANELKEYRQHKLMNNYSRDQKPTH